MTWLTIVSALLPKYTDIFRKTNYSCYKPVVITFLRRDAMIWQKERGERVTGYHRLAHVWIPLCRTNALAFHALLLVAETDRRLSFGLNPW